MFRDCIEVKSTIFFKELPSQGKSERLSVHGEFVMWIKKKMGKGARKVEWF